MLDAVSMSVAPASRSPEKVFCGPVGSGAASVAVVDHQRGVADGRAAVGGVEGEVGGYRRVVDAGDRVGERGGVGVGPLVAVQRVVDGDGGGLAAAELLEVGAERELDVVAAGDAGGHVGAGDAVAAGVGGVDAVDGHVVGRGVIDVERIVEAYVERGRPASSVIAAAGVVIGDHAVVDAIHRDGEGGAGGVAGVAGQRVGHRDGRGFAPGQGLEVGAERNLDLVAGHHRGGIAIGDQGIAEAARRHRAGDGNGVAGAVIGIGHVVGDHDREQGGRVVLAHGVGVGDRQRQVVGAVDGNRHGRGGCGARRIRKRVAERVGERVREEMQLLHGRVGLLTT